MTGIGSVDSGVAPRIIELCLQAKPDATIDEIEWATEEAVAKAKRRGRDKVAFVLAIVAEICAGTGFEEYQAEKQQAAQAEAAKLARDVSMEKAQQALVNIDPRNRAKAEDAWTVILAKLEKEESVLPQSFATLLKPTKGVFIKNRILVVVVPSAEFQHIGVKYREEIKAAIGTLKLKLDAEKLEFPTDEELSDTVEKLKLGNGRPQ